MKDDEEEVLIAQQLQDARNRLKYHQRENTDRKLIQRRLENEVLALERAALDYMKGNGILETERLSLRKSTVVDVPDVDAVPDAFVRTKVTKEPNKILIKELAPAGNWYTINENESVLVKGVEA